MPDRRAAPFSLFILLVCLVSAFPGEVDVPSQNIPDEKTKNTDKLRVILKDSSRIKIGSDVSDDFFTI